MCDICKELCNTIANIFGHLPDLEEFVKFIENSPLVEYDKETNEPILYGFME